MCLRLTVASSACAVSLNSSLAVGSCLDRGKRPRTGCNAVGMTGSGGSWRPTLSISGSGRRNETYKCLVGDCGECTSLPLSDREAWICLELAELEACSRSPASSVASFSINSSACALGGCLRCSTLASSDNDLNPSTAEDLYDAANPMQPVRRSVAAPLDTRSAA